MAEGTSTYKGLGVGLTGDYEIKGGSDTLDTLTITGASSSASGDILVLQNSTGTELLVVSASGFVTLTPYGVSIAGASSFASTLTVTGALTVSATGAALAVTGQMTAILSSTLQTGALTISVTTTGALTADTATAVNAIVVSASSKSVLNSVIQYSTGGGSEVGSAVSYLSVSGTKAPTNFLKIGNSTFGLGAGADNGFFDASMSFGTFPTSAVAVCGLRILSGTATFYLIGYPSTALS